MARGRKKPWGGRFTAESSPSAEAFTESVSFDQRLCLHDVHGSIAHARMLAKCGIISRAEGQKLVKGLRAIEKEMVEGKFPFDPGLEDIHMNVEARLMKKVGPLGGKLHTARSRNDQVALDLRLYLRDAILEIQKAIRRLKKVLLDLGEKNLDVVMAGYTHLRRAQPILFAHHLLAYVEMLKRDEERLIQCAERVNVLPLGSGALSGTSYPIDRAYVAKLLGFGGVSQNSLDAVSDRDFVVEFLAAVSLLMMHLSRFADELILWSGEEFGFLTLPETFCTGSSMMPQKKNPDVLELLRGKTGRVYGALVSVLTLLKGLPLTYHRDLQEDKEPLFDAVDTVLASLKVLAELVRGISLSPAQKARLRKAAEGDFTLATEMADYLVRKGVPFRQAHQITGRVVRHCEAQNLGLRDLDLKGLRRFSKVFEADVFEALTVERALQSRSSPGGTAPRNVRRRLREERKGCGPL